MQRLCLLTAAALLVAPASFCAQNLLDNGDFHAGLAGWYHTDDATCQATVVPAQVGGVAQAVHLTLAPRPGANPWDIGLSIPLTTPIPLGQRVRMTAWLRSPQSCPVVATLQLNRDPWTNFAGGESATGPAWRRFAISGPADRTYAPSEASLNFQLARQAGTLEIAGVEVTLVSDNPLNLIPFVLPWDDAAPGLTNVSGWLDKPAGRNGPVTVRDGHLYTGDKRLRLLGVNICASAAFPRHEQAEKIAARLAKFGVNCVRFHHMDSGWANPGLVQADRLTLSPQSLDALDYLISQLKKNGIYADLNLHVSREYPGQPRWEGMPEYFKGVDNFYSPMLAMQRDYARQLLTHVNPYTGTAYAQEPAVALVEINNENGLYCHWWWNSLDGMPEPYVAELTKLWNAWLGARYPDEAALKAAWKVNEAPPGEEMLDNGDFARAAETWVLEQRDPAKGQVLPLTDGPGGRPGVRLQVDVVDGEGWHVQFHQAGLKIKAGGVYTLSFSARADKPRTISVDCRMAHDPWETLWQSDVRLTPQWKAFRFTVTSEKAEDQARVTFSNLGAQVGSVDLAAVSLRPGGGFRMREGDTYGGVQIIRHTDYAGVSPEMQRDWAAFLLDTEAHYWTGMAQYLKDDLKLQAPVVGTAVGYSPAMMQAKLDVVDGHAYWQHPHFPGRPWDGNNWFVPNVSMAGAAQGGVLPGLALNRVAGKPFTVTEYNHPAPNTHNSEAFLLLAAYGALQDWDGFFAFDYQGGDGWDSRRINGYFDIDQHPTQMATLPTVAALFLRGDVTPPGTRTEAQVSDAALLDVLRHAGPWSSGANFGIPWQAALQRPTALRPPGPDGLKGAAPAGDVITSDNGELTWDATPGRGVVLVNTPRTRGIIGSTARGSFALGDVTVVPGPTLQNWAAITLTVMEGQDFTSPGRSLLTATGYVENSAMGWRDTEKTTVGTDWGHAPSLIEGVPAEVTLPVPAARVHAWALDERGQRGAPVPVEDAGGKALVKIGPAFKTLWYEVVVQ